jgi:hypothetical protein
MPQDQGMTNKPLPTGAHPEAITRYITETFEGVVVAEAMGATFFSCNQSSWPNFASIASTDEHDMGEPSRLSRAGVFRLNIGVGPASSWGAVGEYLYPKAKGSVPRPKQSSSFGEAISAPPA